MESTEICCTNKSFSSGSKQLLALRLNSAVHKAVLQRKVCTVCLLWEDLCCPPGPVQHEGRSCYLGWSDMEIQTLLTWGTIWRQRRAPSLILLSMGILHEHECMITSQGFIFSQWLQYQCLPELPVKHWDIETGFTETEFYLVSILISHREKKTIT